MLTGYELRQEGLNVAAVSEDGDFKVTSYIGYRYHQKIYGYFNYQKNQYIEENI